MMNTIIFSHVVEIQVQPCLSVLGAYLEDGEEGKGGGCRQQQPQRTWIRQGGRKVESSILPFTKCLSQAEVN